MHDLAARGPGRRLCPRQVIGEFLINDTRARDVFARHETERAGAHHLRHLCCRAGAGQALGHDHGRRGMRLADGVQQPAKGARQPDHDGLVVLRAKAFRHSAQRLAEAVALGPAIEACRAVARAHRLAIMEFQAVAQRDLPGQPIGGDGVAGGHLRHRVQLRIHPVERVEDAIPMGDGDRGRGEDRVEDGEVGTRDIAQRARPPLRYGGHGKQWHGGHEGAALDHGWVSLRFRGSMLARPCHRPANRGAGGSATPHPAGAAACRPGRATR